MDPRKPAAHMTPEEWRRASLTLARETLRTAPAFECMVCREWKDRKEADNAYIWEPRPGPLQGRKMRGVPIYNVCKECKDKGPDHVYHKVAQGFLAVGVFVGDEPTEEGKQLLGKA